MSVMRTGYTEYENIYHPNRDDNQYDYFVIFVAFLIVWRFCLAIY